VKFCYHCSTKLSIGTEIFCPECGIKLVQMRVEGKDTRPSIDIKNMGGDVFGVDASGSGNIFGKEVAYTVNRNVINLNVSNLSNDVAEKLRKILSAQTQLPSIVATREHYKKHTTKKNVTKLEHLRETQQRISNVLNDVKKIGKKEGTQIHKIRAGDLQISKNDLLVKDALTRGTELYYKGQYSEALKWYERAIATDTNNAEAWANKGNSLIGMGKYEDAIDAFNRALEIDPDYDIPWASKGSALDSLGRYKEAIECYDKALEINPNDDNTLNNKGLALYNLDRYKEAIEWYDKALEINPNDDNTLFNKGLALFKLGRHKEAIEWYDKALEINPNDATILNFKSAALKKLGK